MIDNFPALLDFNPVFGKILGITGWNPSIYKSTWLHVHILRFSFVELGYIL